MTQDGPDQGAGGAADGRPADPRADRTDGSPPTGEVTLARVPRSALVGLMAEPLSPSIPVRRSTVLMVVAFAGFGVLAILYPPATKTVTTITTNNPNVLPGLLPGSTTTTSTAPSATTTSSTAPPATTTPSTAPSASTTTSTAPSATTTTTTTTRSAGSTTTTLGGTTTTTRVGTASTSTSVTPTT